MKNLFHSVAGAVERCKAFIVSVFAVYAVTCLLGIIMVHGGNRFAMAQRDRIVGAAIEKSIISKHYMEGDRFAAAVLDFGGNLFLGAVPQTVLGLGIVLPYFSIAYQGWVGGIVSMDSLHGSRLDHLKTALYYFITIILQLIAYSFAIGPGIRLGLETYKGNLHKRLKEFRIDKTGLKDVLLAYVLVIPLFFLASCFEFLSNWNT